MGGFSSQVQQGQASNGGKVGGLINSAGHGMGDAIRDMQSKSSQQAAPVPEVQGANGVVTNSATSGQPEMGNANQYNNTVGQTGNPIQQPNQQIRFAGKGGGAQNGGGLGKGA